MHDQQMSIPGQIEEIMKGRDDANIKVQAIKNSMQAPKLVTAPMSMHVSIWLI